MEVFSGAWDVWSLFAVFMVGAFAAVKVGGFLQTRMKRSLLLYCWHTFFCGVYTAYVIKYGGDAQKYYDDARFGDAPPGVGTEFVTFVAQFFVAYLGLGFATVTLCFGVVGSFGLQFFDASLRVATENKSRLTRSFAGLIVFLPSASFWSSGLGKDAISFCGASIALWAALDLGKRFRFMALSIVMMLFVRPHVALILLLALGAGVASMSRNMSTAKRVGLLVGLAAASVVLIPFALNYAGLDTGSGSNDYAKYIQIHQQSSDIGGGAVDISSLSPPMQLYTYLFRPSLIEASNLSSLAAAGENTMLLILCCFALQQRITKGNRYIAGNWVFMSVYSLTMWVVFSLTTANLGIALRQKWMFTPMVIFLVVSCVGKRKVQKVDDGDVSAMVRVQAE